MAQFPWKKGGKKVYSFSDLAAEMDERFNTQMRGPRAVSNPGNVKYTPPTTAKPPKKIRVVGKTGYK